MQKFILSIDQGTTSTRSIIFNDNFEIVSSDQLEFKQYFPKDGCVEHDPQEIFNTVLQTAQNVIKKAKIKLANQDQVRFGPITGQVINISPDVVYSQTGTYYEIEIELEEQKFTSSTMEYTLVPGINVIVFILAGERNVLSYITSPFYNNVGEALQEK